MIPEAGQRFGPYEILGRLGGGGMGVVFRAWDERLHREVAVKLLHESYKMPGMRERFLQEARAASALNHPNICMVFDIGEQNGTPYLVMELLEGETVRSRIEHGALSPDEIVRYALEISDALAAAHTKGIVHRDIKPANIFLVKMPSGKSQAKVLDFGLAKIGLEVRGGWESRTLDMTLSGATVGTVAYMSPEQARGESLDTRSDLFSLGVVLYEMATRRVPFEGTTSALMFVQLLSHTPDSVRNWNESIPRDLERIILKLMAKNRTERFQSTQELQEALTKVGGKLGRGGWLHKGSLSAVPLVRAYDPVALHKGPKRKSDSSQGNTPGGRVPRLQARGSLDSKKLTRPAVGPGGDFGRAPKRSHLVQAGALAFESEGSQRFRRSVYDVVQSNAQDATVQQVGHSPLTGVKILPSQPESIRSRRGLTRFEEDRDDMAERDVPEWLVSEDDSLAELMVEQRKKAWVRMAAAVTLTLGVAMAISLLIGRSLFRPMVLKPTDRLLLTLVQNKTGDKTLDGTVMEGLEIALHQSKTLNVLGGQAYRAGLMQINPESAVAMMTVPVQSVAQKIGARAYLYGEISGSEAPYTISVDVLRADSNDKVASLDEIAGSREEIPAAIGRLALAVRREVSEDSKADMRRTIPFADEASGNLDALHAYFVGATAEQNGRIPEALEAYQEAVNFDPKFVQVQMRLAWLYREEKAEVASAKAAGFARDAAVHASEAVKLLAKFCFEMNGSGDLVQATRTIREYVLRYPLSVDGRRGLALVLRMQRLFPEALQAAQQGYEENPFDAETYVEAERDLVGMDRYGSVLEVASQAGHIGVASSTNVLTAAYLDGREDLVTEQVKELQDALAGPTIGSRAQVTYADLNNYGLYLDNTGKKGAALDLWRTEAAKAGDDAELSGTQASLLAQGALDQALAESCSAALAMVEEVRSLPKGPVASFNAGMAAALCGDQPYAVKTAGILQQHFPRNTAVVQNYAPELKAAAEIGINEPGKAILSLDTAAQYEETVFAAYLRGMAHAALGQTSQAILAFQTVLARRGEASMQEGDLYPMAGIGVARGYKNSRNQPESVEAYRKSLNLWKEADPKQPLMTEALARSR
ncbi:serine/threonine-protein kinase [Tunturiibacter gelidoferens]|uniref:Serine/threonine-protein kinase n=1 Tax=Tunturiibacter gelidiferens TaxID=3069689 RepID=A0ACC5NW46_9BACT|nr:serine/threonine-protein kinase [Edaphobacter lichenicola]MBB5338675.1 serine/threonine-protein kinase [Edaphobacter lichenicola]